jgi:acetylornithine deacetylase/succinyl-diaminopimelate desuccinylase-like protein
VNREKVFAFLDEHFAEHVREVQAFLRSPSISYTGEGIVETANRLVAMIQALGGTAEAVPTPGHPVVYGEIDSGAERTLLIYGMYDVMPADEPGWIVDPWSAEIKDDFLGLGPCILARGAVNTKGPLAAFFSTLAAIQKVEGKLPVNLIFAIEGEEEFGSRNFPGFVQQYKEKLKKADAMFFPFFYCDQEGTPTVTLGTKGLCYFELIANGGEHGGPTTRGIHGSYAAWVNNPNWRLINALASMKNEHEEIRIEGFYDDVLPPNEEDMAILRDLEQFRDDDLFLQLQEVKRFKYDKKGVELYKHLYFDPTLNINGYVSGFIEEGTKTLLPHRAVAKVDIRMVPNMEPAKVFDLVKAHLAKHGYHDIEVRLHNLYPWSKVSVKEPVVQALLKAYEELGRKPQVVPLNPGSAPYYVFQRILEMPYIAGGLGHGSRQHSSNEYCTVQGILDFQKSVVAFLDNFVRLAG